MEYVGWRDVASAMKYIDSGDPFARQRIETALSKTAALPPRDSVACAALPAPVSAGAEVPQTAASTTMELRFTLERHHARVRGEAKARRAIETCCLKNYGMHIVNGAAGLYRITIVHADTHQFDELLELLIDEMYHIAATHSFLIETTITDPQTQRSWS